MAEPTASPPQRVSRYRSLRKAQQQAQPDAAEAPPVPAVPQQVDTHADEGHPPPSRSRYHRKNAVGASPAGTRPHTSRDEYGSELPKSSPRPAAASRDIGDSPTRIRKTHVTTPNNANGRLSPVSQEATVAPTSARVDADGYGAASYESHTSPTGGAVRAQPVPLSSLQPGAASTQPSGELFPPTRPEPAPQAARPQRMDGPPASDKIRATKSMSQLPQLDDDDQRGCFGLFKRKRGDASPGEVEKTASSRPAPAKPAMQDAPVSAVNAGDRRVLIECGKSKTLFPVTPSTTPVDLLKSAATCMSETINVKSAVLLEHFGTVGVQRPLRRYEHVRDVLNSWDNDRQNTLILIDPGTGSSEAELSLAGVPSEKPGGVSWLLFVSQKPGKWDKRMITLRPDGQLTMQRDPNKPQQQENICHLSDFDIYTPTAEKLKKKVKPPKKYCYAIKSQQKTIMFESTENFVHFFCTSDRASADEFYSAVQGWRSWYLVNVMGEGKKPKPAEPSAPSTAAGRQSKQHFRGDSVGSHYQLGSFRPLLDVNELEVLNGAERPADAPPMTSGQTANQFGTATSPERRLSTRRRQHHIPNLSGGPQLAEDEPLGKLARRASVGRNRTSIENSRPDEFAASGLLGRSYSQRQREAAERERHQQQPFTAGPSLLNSGHDDAREASPPIRQSMDGIRRNNSTRANHEDQANGVRRNRSTRNNNASSTGAGADNLTRAKSTRTGDPHSKPLVDLTPQYKEPPQHANKGRGHHPNAVGPGGLIESATSPEDPLGIPSSTDWRGRNAVPGSSSSPHHRTRSVSRPDPRPKSSRSPEHHPNQAFTGEGLLATRQAQQGWGGGDRGRGLVDGSHADGPLLDVTEPSRFAKGSLLRKVERENPDGVPVIDREKREEREVKYGEGY